MTDSLPAGLAGNRRTLLIVLGLTVAYLIVEIVAGLLTNSMGLIADAAHMFTDTGALALSAFAAWMMEKPATPQKTYGYYRVEILAALVNGVLLAGSSLFILYEAYRRFQQPQQVLGLPMLGVATVGLLVNLAGVWVLHGGSQESLNVRSAFYEVVKDALGSLGVIVAGVIILTTGWEYADPIASVLIAVMILPQIWNLLREAVDILLEATPADIDLAALEQGVQDVEGVHLIHDLHVWTIASGFVAMSAHLLVEEGVRREQAQQILVQVGELLRERFGIDHATIQIEYRDLQENEPQLCNQEQARQPAGSMSH